MTRRIHRVGEAMREVIGELLQRGVKDPRIGFVTITAVRVTPDLGHADIYYTVLGDDEQKTDTHEGLQSARPFLRGEIARQMRIKTIPQLEFHFDDAVEHGERVDRLLQELRTAEAEPDEPDGGDET